jgi:protein-disulfide isomerase
MRLCALLAAASFVCWGCAAQTAASKAAAAKKAPAPKAGNKAGPPASGAKSALDKATLEAYVRHLLLWNPQIQVTVSDPKPGPMRGFQQVTVTGAYQKASISEQFYISDDGQKIIRGSVLDVNKSPFQDEADKLKTDLAPSLGTAGAQVVIVLFTDFQCPYCKVEAKMLRDNLVKNYPTQVRLYFKDFPIESIHPWAKSASIAGRCIFRQNPALFWDYHDWIFEKQSEVSVETFKTKLGEWAQTKAQAGLDSLQLSRCVDNRSTEKEVDRSIEEAKELRVNSTPTMFINGRRVPGSVQWEQLKSIIDWELDYTKRTGIGGEKCCEVSLPTPVKN